MSITFNPVFVVGARRSGTTLLQLMLDAHPNIGMTYETGFLPKYAEKVPFALDTKSGVNDFLHDFYMKPSIQLWDTKELPTAEEVYSRMEEPGAGSLLNAVFSILAAQRNKCRWGDKTPDFVLHMPALISLFPNAQFIHIIRDVRDIAVSRLNIRWFSNDIVRISNEWRTILNTARADASTLAKGQYMELRFEDLIGNTKEELQRICEFLHEPYHDDMLQYHQSAEERIPSADMHVHENTLKAPLPSKCNKWKTQLTPGDRMIIESLAGEEMQSLGYELEGVHGSKWKARKSLYQLRGLLDRHLFFRKW